MFAAKFSPDGKTIASGGFDRSICACSARGRRADQGRSFSPADLWNTFGQCDNFAVLNGSKGAILDLQWSTKGEQIYTAGSDKQVGSAPPRPRPGMRRPTPRRPPEQAMVWDAESGERVCNLKGHSSIVNAVGAGNGSPLVVTGSDDGTVRIWDTRRRRCVDTFNSEYPVTSVCFAGTDAEVISGGIDNVVKVWDVRKGAVVHRLAGHTNTVTGLRLSPDGSHVLSNAMDSTVRMWDVRPYATTRLERTFVGAQHGFEKNLIKVAWTPDGKHVAAGSADRNVYVWNAESGAVEYL